MGQLALAIKQKSSMPFPSDIEDDDIWECDIVPLSFEEELLDPTLVEEKKNELAIEEESLLKKMHVAPLFGPTRLAGPNRIRDALIPLKYSTPFRSDPICGSEPDPRCSNTTKV